MPSVGVEEALSEEKHLLLLQTWICVLGRLKGLQPLIVGNLAPSSGLGCTGSMSMVADRTLMHINRNI